MRYLLVANSQFLEQSPITSPVSDTKTGMMTYGWANWLDRIHYKLSTRNYQNVTSAAGVAAAVNLDAQYVALSDANGGDYALTLAAPIIPGTTKVIEMTSRTYGGNVNLDLTNVVGGTASSTCTFGTQGGCLILMSLSTKWVVIKQYNVTLT